MGSRLFLAYFFVLMILSHQLVVSEGRRLRIKRSPVRCGSCMSPRSATTMTKSEAEKSINNEAKYKKKLNQRIASGFVDAFRPTTPGHSPGVGHSIQN